MSRRSGEPMRKNIVTMRERSTSPRTSVYDRLGPPGSHVPQNVIPEDTCRYILKSGHSRFEDECAYDHGTTPVILNSDNNMQDGAHELHSTLVGTDNTFLDKNKALENDGKVNSVNLTERRSSEMSHIKDSIRKHISRPIKLGNCDGSKNKEMTTKKNTRIQMQMGSVVHRGSKSSKIGSFDERSIVSCRKQSATRESLINNLTLDKEPSITSDSCYSGDERDSSTDSISDNDCVIQNITSFGTKSREKALSSISESSFSSVPSTDKKVSGKKKKTLLIPNRRLNCMKEIICDHKMKMKRDSSLALPKCDNLEIIIKGPEIIGKNLSSQEFQYCCHKYSKKHCKRRSYSHTEEGGKFKKDHNSKKRLSKSNTGTRIDSKRSDLLFKTKTDNNKKNRSLRKLKSWDDLPEEVELSNSHSTITENTYYQPKARAKDATIYHPQNETIRNESSTNNRLEFLTSTGILNKNAAAHNNSAIHHCPELNKSIEIESTLKPLPKFHTSEIFTKSENQDKSLDVLISSTTAEDYKVVDNLSLKIHLKRKQNRKLSENIEKKAKKCEDSVNNPKTVNTLSKSFRNNKNKVISASNVISKSVSPVTNIKDGYEIYDSLSDLDQGLILDEDLSTEVSYNFTNDSNISGIDWPNIDLLQSSNYTNVGDTLLSKLGLSYSLLDPDTILKCIDTLFSDIPIHCNIQVHSYLQELSFGTFIEDFLFLEREKLLINLNALNNSSLIKNSDIQFRKMVSGFRNILNFNAVSLPTNPLTSTELFNTAISIYHNLGLSKNI